MIKLDPCPFCKDVHVVLDKVPDSVSSRSFIFHCGGCQMVFLPPADLTEEQVIKLWNGPAERIEEIEEEENATD